MSSRVKVSREEFVKALLHWFVINSSRKAIEQEAKVQDLTSDAPLEFREAKELFGLSLSNRAEFTILVEELMALNLWIIVLSCEMTVKDIEKRSDCLDVFHRRFFEQFLRETGDDFKQWLASLTVKYCEYSEAMKTDLWALAYLIQRNLHGEGPPDAVRQFQIALYVSGGLKALAKALDQYEIE